MAVDVTLLNSNSLTNINTNFERVKTALLETLGRAGDIPNYMSADLDMNGNDILNIKTLQVDDLTIDGTNPDGILQRALDAVIIATAQASAASVSAAAAQAIYLNVRNNWSVERFVGNGTINSFTLALAPGSADNVFMTIDGVFQQRNTFSLVGTLVTLTGVPANLTNIEIAYGNTIDLNTPANGTVTAVKLNVADVPAIRTVLSVYSKAESYAKTEVYNKTETYTQAEVQALLVLDDEVSMHTAVAYGSTATRIIRFATIERDTTSGMVLTQSAVNGDSIAITTTGIYAMMVEVESSDPSREFGITRNQTNLTLGITSNPVAEQVCSAEGTASRRSNAARTMRLAAGDIIRACGDGGTLAVGSGDARFSIVRVQ
jgi:hypothetical protein